MDHYEEIAREDGLDVPQEYRRMCAAGLFSYFGDRSYEDMTEEERLELMRERTFSGKLLYLHYVEWHTPIEGAGMVTAMVPFAGDGSGDQYCWYVPWADKDGRMPLVYFDHEMWTIKGLAPDYASWLFRVILEQCANLECDLFKPNEAHRLVAAYIEMVGPYIKEGHLKMLEEVSTRPLQVEGGNCSLLSEEACQAMLREQVAFEYLGVKIEVEPMD